MWKVDRALAENTRFTQLEGGRWRADYDGFVSVTADGDSPAESERQLCRALDELLASLIRGGKGPKKLDPVAVFAGSMLSDAITVVNNIAKETAEWKREGHQQLAGTIDAPADVRKPRKRR